MGLVLFRSLSNTLLFPTMFDILYRFFTFYKGTVLIYSLLFGSYSSK